MLDTKKMIQEGFQKNEVAIVVNVDRNGKEHPVIVDTIKHANEYKSSGTIVRQATIFYKEHHLTDLDMLRHLLKKTGRIYNEYSDENRTIIQVHSFNGRTEFDFDKKGNLVEDWDNSSVTTWISEGAYIYD